MTGTEFEGAAAVTGISYAEFEVWWKQRNGIDDVDIPVFPESMIRRARRPVYYAKSLPSNHLLQ